MNETKKKKLLKLKASLNGGKNKEILEFLDLLIDKVNNNNKKTSKKIEEFIEMFNSNEIKKEDVDKILKEIKSIEFPEYPTEIKVNNFPEQKELKQIKVSNLKEIKIPEQPKEIKVSNLKDFPKEIKVKKPVWYKQIDFGILINAINSGVQNLMKTVFKVDLNEYKKVENAIAVKMVGKTGKQQDLVEVLSRLSSHLSGPTGSGPQINHVIVDKMPAVQVTADIEGANTKTIYNKTMTNADTEYSQALPAYTKKFTIQCRGDYDVKLAFDTGESGTKYITVKAGQNYYEDLIDMTSITLFIQCATAGQVAEIVAWNRV